MSKLKITIIGGGSFMWTPKIVTDIVDKQDLGDSQIVLHDIDSEALDLTYRLSQKIIEKAKANFTIKATIDLEEALEEADFVILTISPGGLEVMRSDLEIPLKYGVYQAVGDTVGPAGIFRALRSIPVVVNIAKKMEGLCPDVWMINYSNPMSTLCRAINRATKVKTIGLCHEPIEVLDTLKRVLQIEDESDIQVKIAGINHLAWILELKIRGEDGFPLLRNYIENHMGEMVKAVKEINWSDADPFRDNNIIKFELFRIFGYLPAAGDRHIAEFFPYFLTDGTKAGREYGVKLTTIEDRLSRRKNYRRQIQNMLNGKQPLKMRPSREAVSNIISASVNQREEFYLMNLPNRRQITNLPEGVVIETLGRIDSDEIHGVSIGDLPLNILSTIYPHVINQELVVEAGLTGNRKLVFQALSSDPLVTKVKKWENVKKMLDELLQINHKYLPQF